VPAWGWVRASELEPGMSLAEPDGALAVVEATRWEPRVDGTPVYNFEVAGAHTYYVAAQGIRAPPVLVHNKCSTVVEDGIEFGLDKRGRVVSASVTVSRAALHTGSVVPSSVRKTLPGLMPGQHDAGHLIAKVLGGTGKNSRNVFAQLSEVNRGAMAARDKMIAGLVRQHGKVDVRVGLEYVGDRVKRVKYDFKLPGGEWMSMKFAN